MSYTGKSCRGKLQKNVNWRGDKASYFAKHLWMVNNYGNPKSCERCGAIGKPNRGGRWSIHWANKSGKFKRDLSDWLCLCVSCHRKYDYGRGAHHVSGETHQWAKLTLEQVKEMRVKYKPRVYGYRKLAEEYNVSIPTVYMIIKKINWKNA